jgi:hypothetical protein
MNLPPEDEAFLKELSRRVPPNVGITVTTRAGKITVSPDEKHRLDALEKQTGQTAQQLIDQYL